MNLPELKLLFLTFHLEAQKSVVLPPFLGSTLRGAFGTALKKVFCFVPHGECERCWFYEACPYQYLFESPNLIPPLENHPLLKGQREVPQPFVLTPPNPVQNSCNRKIGARTINFNEDYAANHFSRGETLVFSIALIGKAVSFWAQILVAVRLLAEYGLGERRVPFILTKAFAHDSKGTNLEIFQIENPRISSGSVAPISLSRLVGLRLQSLQRELSGKNFFKIQFQTPTRLRIGDAVKTDITFLEIFKKIVERLEFLAFLHTEVRQRLDYRPILPAANKILVNENLLKTYRFEQFSNAQNRKTRRETVLGAISFRTENLEQILPFLLAGEIFNIGTNISYGFGRITVALSEK